MAMTIPELFEAAVAEVPDKPWLLYEDETFTYAQARDRIGRAAGTLAELGVGAGDLVLATAHNRPEYLFTWLAGMYLGAIHMAVDPRSTESELAGLAGQVEPKLVVDDDNVAGLFTRAGPTLEGPGPARPDDPAVLIPTSGTTGRSKLVTQTQRAYAMAGEGFPWWLELTPDDRLMTSLPLFHINAPAYSVLGSVAARASLVLLPGFSASTFIDSARRHGATEFNAIGAMLEILMRQPERPDDADSPLRLCYTGPSPTEERQLEIERRFGLRIMCGYAMSETPYGTVWAPRHQAVRHPRVDPPAPDARRGQRRPRAAATAARSPPARSASCSCAIRPSCAATGVCPRRRAASCWTTDGCGPATSCATTATARSRSSAARRRSSGAAARMSRRPRSRRCSCPIPTCSRRRPSEFPRSCPRRRSRPSSSCAIRPDIELPGIRAWAAERLTRFKVPRYLEAVAELPHTATGRVAKHRLDRGRSADEIDFEAVGR